mmetsp:Transcript_84722/g.177180  ORF Transcript_84722/g.177180 Transcript_84722/m.177180 type:complete len:1165 (-) Transcript_84722:875-4369(-)
MGGAQCSATIDPCLDATYDLLRQQAERWNLPFVSSSSSSVAPPNGSTAPALAGKPQRSSSKLKQANLSPRNAPADTCAACEKPSEELSKGKLGKMLCRKCLRIEDESNFEPLSPEERQGLDLLAGVLDSVPWSYWKPGEQPAPILPWLFLGDLEEALDVELLRSRGISAVLNLVNWWELISKRPDIGDLSFYYSAQDIVYKESDSEDRLFFDMVEQTWPDVKQYLEDCHREGRRVIVHCKAGHNRSACIVVCWLVVCEGMTLLEAASQVQRLRGTILSNHGFRLQLVRLALRLQRLGNPPSESLSPALAALPLGSISEIAGEKPTLGRGASKDKVGNIIKIKRLSVKYDRPANSNEMQTKAPRLSITRSATGGGAGSLISAEVQCMVSQRALSAELLAVLWHQGKSFSEDYEYTADPPVVIGSGFSGDVALCRRKGSEGVRCVKAFNLENMEQSRLEKLKNETLIYLSLEHPNIARLFDVFMDPEEVSLVMQYCSGGTLEHVLKNRGPYPHDEFEDLAVQMLRAVHYIHRAGIVHRDIKPRNFVYEAGLETVKLIDFGFSVKGYLAGDSDKAGLRGCMGTLGYLAPEVARASHHLQADYTEKCDLWSLGCVFFEMLSGRPAFHREHGQCDGYTEEVVLREIESADEESVANLLEECPRQTLPLLQGMMAVQPEQRPSAREALNSPCLSRARSRLSSPRHALPIAEVLARFRNHGNASKTSRAYLLARARCPTDLPWPDFCALRDTFKMFDSVSLNGTIDLQAFQSIVMPVGIAQGLQTSKEETERIWGAVCGEQESLSYCEFLAALIPHAEDVFQDEPQTPTIPHDSVSRWVVPDEDAMWDPSQPIGTFLPLLQSPSRERRRVTFSENETVKDTIRQMSEVHLRYSVVRYNSGKAAFFDFMDVNKYLVKLADKGTKLSTAANQVSSMLVGSLANISGQCAWVPMPPETPLIEILRLISQPRGPNSMARRIPIVDANGEVLDIFSCLDFLKLAQHFPAPRAILKSRSARSFDTRDTIINDSVLYDESMESAFRTMLGAHLTICPAVSREMSGDFGGVLAINVVSITDLKWVFNWGAFDKLDCTVNEFLTWRAEVTCGSSLASTQRQRTLSRFNVVSVDEDDSLLALAERLHASGLQRIFLSCEELARIVGIVSSRDILVEVIDQL